MATNSPKKAILVTGATGKQGGATIDALLNAGALGQHRLLAVTRNPGSGAAKKLEAKGVKVIQGDFRDVPGIFSNAKAALGGTAIGKGASSELEEVQGKALVDAALSNKVKFFVYSSVDRGGERSFDNPTVVPHFISKHNVEHHLVDSARTTDMQWTILRPTALMENFTPDFGTKVTATAWRVAVKEKPLQLISIRDIGWFAAQAFMRPGDFAGRAISLAGDELTLSQANAVFKSKVGHEMPETFRFLARLLLWYSAEFGNMFRWFYTDCYGAEIKALKAEHPGLLSLSAWLDQSDWMKKSA
ncbi:hypothetical protein DL762_008058 [Monosporascus cannonballus]|uniref:NmrA-like domain-containing protein n=1 Tax=Monosporascus cannonballus TaxID=155416 RepID=A0ABY0GXA3_9PEZI|nr:hypothetical protein DL762_008058 [Monosporascus cannonballus]RYO95305.1 hypothetical protein DL763_003729 [Monosporascus cannonballus]